ncbi:short repeat uncharacterized protein DUF308 [Glaciihabitans tibetensis]|uniref:Short repeat uncharacterized protein DUF308 n=2 Tax=Glaciihabitans tibetensis TaxID=1266600 RepID=A0A2T0VCT9_9MICO|nr:short repeat uncharacterized protein DUF308 [Glaciihabitans tibetensis]
MAVLITFNADHSATLGLLSFGIFAVLSGLALALLSSRPLGAGVQRSIFIGQGILTVLAGLVALIWPSAGLGFFLFLLSAWAALTGFLELYAGLRTRGRHAASRDWLFVGGLTVILAVVVLVVPPDLQQQFSGQNGVSGVLSTSIIVVGCLGAYGAIAAVYLVIAGLSLKWAPAEVAAAEAGSTDAAPTEAAPTEAVQDGNPS